MHRLDVCLFTEDIGFGGLLDELVDREVGRNENRRTGELGRFVLLIDRETRFIT